MTLKNTSLQYGKKFIENKIVFKTVYEQIQSTQGYTYIKNQENWLSKLLRNQITAQQIEKYYWSNHKQK